jgi:hypothetical protein
MVEKRSVSIPVMGLGVVIILMGLWIVSFPNQLPAITDWESRRGLWMAAAMRVATGVILVVSASSTRYPKGLRIFGYVIVCVGLLLPLVPLELWSEMVHWWLVEKAAVYRVAGGIGGGVLGVFFVYAAMPEQSDA